MDRETIYSTIKTTIHACLPLSRIMLFGSQAKGNYDEHSDYDLLIIVPAVLAHKQKAAYSAILHKDLVKAIHAPVDVLLFSEDEVSINQTLPGHIVRTAIREGISL